MNRLRECKNKILSISFLILLFINKNSFAMEQIGLYPVLHGIFYGTSPPTHVVILRPQIPFYTPSEIKRINMLNPVFESRDQSKFADSTLRKIARYFAKTAKSAVFQQYRNHYHHDAQILEQIEERERQEIFDGKTTANLIYMFQGCFSNMKGVMREVFPENGKTEGEKTFGANFDYSPKTFSTSDILEFPDLENISFAFPEKQYSKDRGIVFKFISDYREIKSTITSREVGSEDFLALLLAAARFSGSFIIRQDLELLLKENQLVAYVPEHVILFSNIAAARIFESFGFSKFQALRSEFKNDLFMSQSIVNFYNHTLHRSFKRAFSNRKFFNLKLWRWEKFEHGSLENVLKFIEKFDRNNELRDLLFPDWKGLRIRYSHSKFSLEKDYVEVQMKKLEKSKRFLECVNSEGKLVLTSSIDGGSIFFSRGPNFANQAEMGEIDQDEIFIEDNTIFAPFKSISYYPKDPANPQSPIFFIKSLTLKKKDQELPSWYELSLASNGGSILFERCLLVNDWVSQLYLEK